MTARPPIAADRGAAGAFDALAQLRDAPGMLLARYRSAITVETAPGRLLTVQTPDTPLSPFGLVLAHALPVAWPEPGSAATVRGRILEIGTLRIELRHARPAPAIAIPPPAATWDPSSAGRRLQPLAQNGAFGPIWTTRGERIAGPSARRAVQALMAAARDPNVGGDLTEPAVQMMGRGPGATPSGDDLLVGFLASWLTFRPDETAPDLARRLALTAPVRTSRIAAEFYHHLALGCLTDRLALLLRAVAEGKPEPIMAAAASLAAFGATSGRDTIAGIVCYLQAQAARPTDV